MKLLSWNVRGPEKLKIVCRSQHVLKDLNLIVIFLMETKLQNTRMESVRRSCGFSNGVDITPVGSSGGLFFYGGKIIVLFHFDLIQVGILMF